MRTAAAVVIAFAGVAAMVPFLMREEFPVGKLVAVGGVAGLLSGGVRWGGRGALVGVTCGCLFGLVAPMLYIPFWCLFTLPPHPEMDL